MPGCIGRRVRVVKVGYLLIPLVGTQLHGDLVAVRRGVSPLYLEFGLENIREVRVVLDRFTMVDQECRNGARSARDVFSKVLRCDRSLHHVNLETA